LQPDLQEEIQKATNEVRKVNRLQIGEVLLGTVEMPLGGGDKTSEKVSRVGIALIKR